MMIHCRDYFTLFVIRMVLYINFHVLLRTSGIMSVISGMLKLQKKIVRFVTYSNSRPTLHNPSLKR